MRLYGDVRARARAICTRATTLSNTYLDFNAVNDAGGIGRAGEDAFLNTTEDRNRAGRARARRAQRRARQCVQLDVRLASGNVRSPVSTNQTLGNYGGRWTVNVDKAAVIWNPVNRGARPRVRSARRPLRQPVRRHQRADLGQRSDVRGPVGDLRAGLFGNDPARMERGLFLTLGAFPLQEVELSTDDKWLYGAQLGAEFAFGARIAPALRGRLLRLRQHHRRAQHVRQHGVRLHRAALPAEGQHAVRHPQRHRHHRPTCSRWPASTSSRMPTSGSISVSATRTSWSAAST